MSRTQEILPNGTLLSTGWNIEVGNGASMPANHHTAISDKKPPSTKISSVQWTRIRTGAATNQNFRASFGTYTLDTDERCRRVRLSVIAHTTGARVKATIGNGTSATEPLGGFEMRKGGTIVEWLYGPWVTKAMTNAGVANLEWGQAQIDDLRLRFDPITSLGLGDCGVYEAYIQLDIVEKPAPASITPFDGQVFPTTTPTLRWGHQVPEAQKKFDLKVFTAAVAEDSSFDVMTSTAFVYRAMQSTSATTHRIPDGILAHGEFYYVFVMTAVDFNGEDWWSDWDDGTSFKINAKPTVTVTGPVTPVPDTAKPIVEWNYDDDEGDLQSAFRVVVLERPVGNWPGIIDPNAESLNNNAIHDSGFISSGNTDYDLPVALLNNTNYRAYVQVQQRVPSVLNSEWSYIEFDMAFYSPLSPEVAASAAGEAIDVQVRPTVPNLTTADVSSLEGGTGTWQAGTNTTIAQSAAQFLDGTKSLSLTRTTSTGDSSSMSSLLTTGQVPVTAGATYTAQAWFKANSTVRSCRVGIEWINSANASISVTSGDLIQDSSTEWRRASVTGEAPVGAVNARIVVTALAAVVAEIHFVDQVQLSYGGLGLWNIGGGTIGVTLDMDSSVCLEIVNKLTVNQASLETNTAGWVAGASSTIARSTAQFLQGAASLLVTRTGTTGDATATTDIAPPMIPCMEMMEYSAIASFRAVGTGRVCSISLRFFDEADVEITMGFTNVQTTVTDNSSSWQQATTRAVAPMGAHMMAIQVTAAGALATEGHYVDAIGVFEDVVTTWSAGDAHTLDVADMEIRFGLTLIDWLPEEDACLVYRWDFEHDRECSWAVWLLTDGKLRFDWSVDGSEATKKSATSTASVGIAAGTLRYIRITFDEDNGAAGQNVSFFQGASITTATTAVGTNPVTVATVETIYDGFAPLCIGGTGMAGGWNGYVTELEMRNSIGGTIVTAPVFATQPIGTMAFRDTQGRFWELHGEAELEMKEKPNADFFNVERSRDGGTTWEHFRYDTGLVMSDRVPGSLVPFTMRDHEVPLNTEIMYRAEAISVGLGFDSNSAPSDEAMIVLEGSYVWIKDCVDSSRNRSFHVSDKWLKITHNRNRKVFQPLGRDMPVVIRGSGMADRFSVSFLILSTGEHDILHDLIDSDHLLFLQTPKGSWWCEVANEMDLSVHLWDALRGEGDVYQMTVPFQEVDRLRESSTTSASDMGGGH